MCGVLDAELLEASRQLFLGQSAISLAIAHVEQDQYLHLLKGLEAAHVVLKVEAEILRDLFQTNRRYRS